MKNEKKRGIALVGAPQIKPHKNDRWFDTAILMVASMLLLVAMEGSLLSMADLSVNIPLLGIGGMAGLGLCYLFYLFPKSRIAVTAVFIIIFIVLVVFPGGLFGDGMAITTNGILSGVGCTFGHIYLPLSVSDGVDVVMATTVFQWMIVLVLSVFCTYMVCAQDQVILLLSAVVFVVACLVSVFSPYWLWYGLFFLALSFIMLKQLVKAKGGATPCKLLVTAFGLLFVLSATLFVLFGAVFSVNHYEKPGFAQTIENDIHSMVERIIYGSDTTNNLPQGDFTKISALKLSDKTALKISMSQPESLYLRGYVGSVYTASGWQELDKKSLYDNGALFYWLHKDGFYGFSQLAMAAEAAGDTTKEDKLTVSVTGVGVSDQYVYTPYEYMTEDDTEALYRIGDTAPNRDDFEDGNAYTFTALTNRVKSSASLALTLSTLYNADDAEVKAYLNDENNYREFVYDDYLELPSIDKKLLSTELGDATTYEKGRHADYDVAMQSILDYLTDNITYDENVSAPPDGEDFLTYFLTQSAKGYSVHYATAAALMFRYYGIPARYVEGYIVTPDDVAGVSNDETIKITGKNAHAWVEYYRDGVGWVPFEVTPAYLFVMEQPENEAALISDEYDNDSSEKGSIDMTNDNYEDNVDDSKTTTNDDTSSISPVVIAVAGGSTLILMLLIAFIALAIRRAVVLKKRKKVLAGKTEKDAVNDLFGHTLALLFAGGLEKKNGSLGDYIAPLEERSDIGLSWRFKMFLALQREAQFSNHPISTARRRIFEAFQKEVVDDFKARTKLRKRFKEKYIKNRY